VSSTQCIIKVNKSASTKPILISEVEITIKVMSNSVVESQNTALFQAPSDSVLGNAIIFTIVCAFISGPTLSVGPIDLRLFDFAFLILLLTTVPYILQGKITLPSDQPLLGIFSFYMLLAVGLPILGVIIYQYPIGYLVGDLRWFQSLFIGLAVLLYSNKNSKNPLPLIENGLKIGLIVNLIFVLGQILHWMGIYDASLIFGWYYVGQNSGIESSYHIGRFAGATGSISALGLFASISILFFSVKYLKQGTGLLFFLTAVILLGASGTRTSFLVVISYMFTFLILYVVKNLGWVKIKRDLKQMANVLFVGLVSTPIVTYILYYYNIGRVRSGNRLNEMFGVITGTNSFGEVSGRTARWEPVFEYVSSEFIFGTLANPSWVLNDFPAIDSYYVITYLQGGSLFLISYIILLLLMFKRGIQIDYNGSVNGSLVIGICLIMLISSMTQNFMTSISGKLIMVLCVTLCLVGLKTTKTSSTNQY